MVEEKNQLLGYAIDKLIKAFNPNRKGTMHKYELCKLMNLLEDRLKTLTFIFCREYIKF
jgi:hypothetical protein